MAQAGPKWLLQITPTPQGLARYPTWQAFPGPVLIWDKADRDQRIKEAREALHSGDIAAFRCDRI